MPIRNAFAPLTGALLALCAVASHAQQVDQSLPYRDDESGSFVTITADDVDTSGSLLRVAFQPEEIDRIPIRYQHTFWLVGSPNDDMTLTVEDYEWSYLDGDGNLFGPFPSSDTEQNGIGNLRLDQISEKMTDVFRSVGLYRVELPIVRVESKSADGKSEQFRIFANRIDLKCDTGTAPANPPPLPLEQYDPYLLRILPLLAANHAQAPLVADVPPPAQEYEELLAWNTMLERAAQDGPLLMAKLTRGGLYALKPDDLRRAGLDPAAVDSDRIRFFAGRQELMAYPMNIERNRLQGKGSLIINVPLEPSDRKPYEPLWVFLAPEGETAPRATVQPGGPSGNPSSLIPATVTRTIFKPEVFNYKQDSTAPQLRWATASVAPGSFSKYEFEMGNPAPDLEATLDVWLGKHDRLVPGFYQFTINDHAVETGQLDSARVERLTVKFPTELLTAGTNSFALVAREPAPGERSSSLSFIQAELQLPTLTESIGPNIPFRLENTEIGNVPMALRKYEGMDSNAVVADITDPLVPKFYKASTIVRKEGAVYSTSIETEVTRPRLIHATPDSTFSLAGLTRTAAPTFFLKKDPVDYLFVAHSSLAGALQPLAEHHASTRKVETVTVEELYNAFSYGELKYEAIRDGIRHAFLTREGARLSEVLLVGEASEYWWDESLRPKEFSPNLLPIFGWRNPTARIRGDEGYSLLFGDGPLPDVEIGRISADTPHDVSVVVAKSIAYDEEPPSGDWRLRNDFVMDDEPEFERVAKDIIRKTFSGPNIPRLYNLQEFGYENYFRGFWRKRSVEMTDSVVKALSDGARTVTYLGHGGPNLWSEERIFHIRDIDSTVSDGRLPVLLAGSCDTGWVDYPSPPVNTSLSEHFLRRENGGSVAAYIPVGATSSYEHNFILSAFFDPLMNHGIGDLGELVLLSKIGYYLDRNNQSVTEQFILMGDPALRIVSQPDLETASVGPAEFLSYNSGKLSISAQMPGMEWGMASATLVGPEKLPIVTERFRVTQGTLRTTMNIPRFLEPGNYSLILSMINDLDSTQASRTFPLVAKETKVRIERTAVSTDEELKTAGYPLEVAVTIHNDSQSDLIGAELETIESDTGMVINRTPISVPAGGSISPRFERRLPLSVSSVLARVSIPVETDGRVSRTPLAETTIILPQANEYTRFVSFPASAVEVRHSEEAGTQILVPVFNMTNKPLESLAVALRRQDKIEGTRALVGKTQTLPAIAPGQKAVAEFTAVETLPTGEQTFSFEVYDVTTTPSKPLQIDVFTLNIHRGVDIEIVDGSFELETDRPRAGNTVFLRYRVRNSGDVPVNGVTARLYKDEPWVDRNLANSAVPWAEKSQVSTLLPGEEYEFRLRWDPDNSNGRDKLFATVSLGVQQEETDLANNIAMMIVDMIPSPNLAILKDDVRRSRLYALPYEIVNVTVPIANTSDQDFLRDFRVSAYAISNDGTRDRKFTRRFDEMLAGESATLQFDWKVLPNEHELYIEVNEDREYLETTHNDNVMTIPFLYMVDEQFFPDAKRLWDFSGFPNYGTHKGVMGLPSGAIGVSSLPRAEDHSFGFDTENLVSGEVGDDLKNEDLWGLRGTQLLLSFDEIADGELYYRFPLPEEDRTAYYDVYIDNAGAVRPEMKSGHFRYRFEDEANWDLQVPKGPGGGYFGRFHTRDDVLDFHLKSAPYPAFNHIYSLTVSPVMGIYESPAVRYRHAPQGRIMSDVDDSAGGAVYFDTRFGTLGEKIEWNDWVEVPEGEAIPTPPQGSNVFQWRARLVADPAGSPLLNSVRIEVVPGAADRESPEMAAGK